MWGRGVIFFLLKLFFTHDSRTLPGFALPGVSTTLLFGDQLAVCDARLRTPSLCQLRHSTTQVILRRKSARGHVLKQAQAALGHFRRQPAIAQPLVLRRASQHVPGEASCHRQRVSQHNSKRSFQFSNGRNSHFRVSKRIHKLRPQYAGHDTRTAVPQSWLALKDIRRAPHHFQHARVCRTRAAYKRGLVAQVLELFVVVVLLDGSRELLENMNTVLMPACESRARQQ